MNAWNKYVMPGGVDAHVHLQMTIGDGSAELAEAITSSDDFTTGTIAAACGGTTTVIDFIKTPSPARACTRRWPTGARRPTGAQPLTTACT